VSHAAVTRHYVCFGQAAVVRGGRTAACWVAAEWGGLVDCASWGPWAAWQPRRRDGRLGKGHMFSPLFWLVAK
jgi:hypothetical protein